LSPTYGEALRVHGEVAHCRLPVACAGSFPGAVAAFPSFAWRLLPGEPLATSVTICACPGHRSAARGRRLPGVIPVQCSVVGHRPALLADTFRLPGESLLAGA